MLRGEREKVNDAAKKDIKKMKAKRRKMKKRRKCTELRANEAVGKEKGDED